MARSTLAATTITAMSSNGYNLTDSADFTTMSTGSGNGLEFVADSDHRLVLKNSTGGAATVTFILGPTFSEVTGVGGSVTDPEVTIADGKTHVMPKLPSALIDSDGKVKFDCDVALSALLLDT
jgi:hypothetical protein